MDPVYSRLIIVDLILCDTDLIQSSMGIQMMTIGSGVERSEHQWRELLGSAGFEIRGIWDISPGVESVIEAVPGKGAWKLKRDAPVRRETGPGYTEDRVSHWSSPYAGLFRR